MKRMFHARLNLDSGYCEEYGVQQIQIDSNGYGKAIFDAIESLGLDIDIVPIIYQAMRL